MWVLDDARDVAEGVAYRGDLDATAHVLNSGTLGCAERQQTRHCGTGIGNTPISDRTACAVRNFRVEAKLAAADVEADIERLVEVWRDAEDRRIPGLGLGDVRCVVKDSVESVEVWVFGWCAHVS